MVEGCWVSKAARLERDFYKMMREWDDVMVVRRIWSHSSKSATSTQIIIKKATRLSNSIEAWNFRPR